MCQPARLLSGNNCIHIGVAVCVLDDDVTEVRTLSVQVLVLASTQTWHAFRRRGHAHYRYRLQAK
jgi:hypothetical protein